MSSIKGFYVLFIELLLSVCLGAQTPFLCNGDSYIIANQSNSSSVLYNITVDISTATITFDPLAVTDGYTVNSIGYRITDNLIYGIDYVNNTLYRFDANGAIENLGPLGLPGDFLYPAGDISPDGKSLVLMGNSLTSDTILISFIDLESGDYDISNYEMTTWSGDPVFCTDIAFHPLTQQLFGFDATSQKLVTIDVENQEIDNNTFPTQDNAGNIPALFFDAFGHLFGLGNTTTSSFASLYKIDTETGTVTFVSNSSDISSNRDACSCPYTVAMFQKFQDQVLFPCTETNLTIEISNLSGSTQTNVTLNEIFQEDLTVLDIVYNPYIGNIGSTIGSNELLISEMTIPEGIDSIILNIQIGHTLPGTYLHQAKLSGIDLPGTPGLIVLSDNPDTPIKRDSSVLEIIPLSLDLDNNRDIMCEGTELILQTVEGVGLNYLWSDNSVASQLSVSSPGLYAVTVSIGCEYVSDSIEISLATLTLELGEDLTTELGNEILLTPSILSFGDIADVQWSRDDEFVMNCIDCTTYTDQVTGNATYRVFVTDEFGCQAEDSVNVTVFKDYNIYTPNVFSPNGDGISDRFYLQTKHDQMIRIFRIFDRWGNLVFEKSNITTNSPNEGWDGTSEGNDLQEGVYIWTATVEFLDGNIQKHSGDLLILR